MMRDAMVSATRNSAACCTDFSISARIDSPCRFWLR